MKGEIMTPKEAMEFIIDMGLSKYMIAKVMDMQPIMVDNFLNGKQKTIRREAAEALKAKYDVTIDDNYINGYQKRMFIDKHNNLRGE